jgi:uncharacterized protein YdhG (YjbR/CyaY superfamily)
MGERNPAVDRCLLHAPVAHRHAYDVIRELIHRIRPNVLESVHYNMPLFDYHGLLCGFASQLNAISLYCREEILERYRHQLDNVDVGKGRIRFQQLEELPLDVIRAIFIDSCAALDHEFTGQDQRPQDKSVKSQDSA